MSHKEEAPAVQGERFEFPALPIQGKNMNTSSIAETTAPREAETLAEWNERDKTAKAAWLAAHPEAAAAKPDWAEKVWLEWEPDGTHTVTYERTIGLVLLARWSVWENGVIRFMDGSSAPEAFVNHAEVLTLEQMRELASDLMAAIPVLEEAMS